MRLRLDRVVPPGDTLSALQAALLGASTEAGPWDGLWVSEARHDPFFATCLCSRTYGAHRVGYLHCGGLFRSPMTLAYTAWDLQRLSEGRFNLGIGSQVRAHIEQTLLHALEFTGSSNARLHHGDARDLVVMAHG
jgi:alkanesulfonate monooxygenase SsuD/methylene tetrahydromethanopterin reductase-like flavin-dependent oxidoreductase (luciferase family)